MSYVPSEETFNLPHVVVDSNGDVMLLTFNHRTAALAARFWNRSLPVTCTVRPADEDDVASFMRRLGDC